MTKSRRCLAAGALASPFWQLPRRPPGPRHRSPRAGPRPPTSAASRRPATAAPAAWAASCGSNATGCAPSSFVEGGGVYQAAREGELFAVGTPASFELVDQRDTVTKAEKYFLETGFERRVTEKFYWTVGGGWRRDIFSGVEHQVSARGGVGYVDVSPRSEFKAAALATYTDQQDIVEDPELENPFFGGRMTFDFLKKFGEGDRSQFKTFLAVDQNFQTSEDTRILWDNALTVTMTARLALQVGYILNWRNLPALEEIPVFSLQPPAGVNTGTVLRRLDKLDQTFQVSLVVNWSPRPPSAAKPTP